MNIKPTKLIYSMFFYKYYFRISYKTLPEKHKACLLFIVNPVLIVYLRANKLYPAKTYNHERKENCNHRRRKSRGINS